MVTMMTMTGVWAPESAAPCEISHERGPSLPTLKNTLCNIQILQLCWLENMLFFIGVFIRIIFTFHLANFTHFHGCSHSKINIPKFKLGRWAITCFWVWKIFKAGRENAPIESTFVGQQGLEFGPLGVRALVMIVIMMVVMMLLLMLMMMMMMLVGGNV